MTEDKETRSPLRGVRQSLLHRPEPPSGSLVRSRLNARLDEALTLPACTICAPAGFGKSIAVSQWCETLDRPSVWLSVDRSVDDPRWFVLHLVGAVREAYPGAFPVVSQMANGSDLPGTETLIVELSNEFDALPGPIVVVFDDFQLLTSPECVEIVSELVRHPARSAHFVIVSRHEPPIRIAQLGATGRVVELRIEELAFTSTELEALIGQELDLDLAGDRIDELFESTEGWPAGVRLTIEALRHAPSDVNVVGAGLLDQAAQEYLVTEVLDRTPHEVRQHLLAASFFERFSAELCDAVAATRRDRQQPMAGADFIAWMRRNGMFIVPLDPEGEWFRFHHLFAGLLASWRAAHQWVDEPEAEMRRAAADVFRAHRMFEEAIAQLDSAGDDSTMIHIATERGGQLLEQERWSELARLLDHIPRRVFDRDAGLLLLQAWWLGHTQTRLHEMSAALTSVEALIGDDPEESNSSRRGQVAALRAAYEKIPAGDLDGAIGEADTACQLLTATPGRNLSFAHLIATVSRAVAGRFTEADRIAHSTFGDARFAGSPNDPMIWAMPYIGWEQGDLAVTERYGTQLRDIGERFELHDAVPGAAFFLGRAAYERNDLTTAESELGRVVDLRFATRPLFLAHAWMALALTELAQGRRHEADATASAMMQFVLSMRSDALQPVAEAFMAWVDLRQGRPTTALRWARGADLNSLGSGFTMFFDEGPTLVEVLLSSESQPDIARGRLLLDQYRASAEQRHNHPLTLHLLGLDALDMAARGDEARALDSLRSAVTMSCHSGMIRRLADLGPRLAPLLHRLDVEGDVLVHVGAILEALEPTGHAETATDAPGGAMRPVPRVVGQPSLTARELDVLLMLADRYSNKEIARELLIAPATVKKHTVTLYDKLNVHSRQEAVTKARTLGYLST